MKLIDTHCHLDMEIFDADREQLFANARQQGLAAFVVPAVDRASWDRLVALRHRQPDVYIALGLHPMFMQRHKLLDITSLRQYISRHQPVVALGEIGLDFYQPPYNRDAQILLFRQQLEIAASCELPVIVHARKSLDDILSLLKTLHFDQGGIMHAFNGSQQQAEKFINLGFKLGFGGMLTYERSSKLRKLAADLPLSSLVLETDAPDMTVASHHGQRNSPEYLPEVLAALAEIRQEPVETIAEQLYANSCQVLRLPETT